MDGHTYRTLHSAADRLALEASRKQPLPIDAAALYIKAYEKVLAFLISEYKKHDPEE